MYSNPFEKVDEPQSEEYQRIKRKYLWESVVRGFGGYLPFHIVSLPCIVYFFKQVFTLPLMVALVWTILFECLVLLGVLVNAKRQLRLFISYGWELSDDLISPDVKREFLSPCDTITSYRICAEAFANYWSAYVIDAEKSTMFSHQRFDDMIRIEQNVGFLKQYRAEIRFIAEEGKRNKVVIQSQPGFARFQIQDGQIFHWITKLAHKLEQLLNEKYHAIQAPIREKELERIALQSQLAALQAQVEPHFIINTLANLKYLMRTDNQAAENLLQHLVSYLQTAMPDMRRISSNVGKELAFIEHYLHIMQIRMGKRLEFSFDIDTDLREVAMPPAMLISLVENAIKHGLEKATRPGHITIQCAKENTHMRLSVIDDGVGLGDHIGQGVGLSNIHQRLQLLYGESAQLLVTPNQAQGVIASLILPIANNQNRISTEERG